MPRGKKRTTQTGADAQTIGSVPGQRYGEGVEQQALQRAMPAPQVDQGLPDGQNAPRPSSRPSVAAQPPEPAGPDMAAVQQYLAQNNPRLFDATQRPDEPVMTGLPMGPGAGPEVLAGAGARAPLARFMNDLAAQTGNAKWRHLAERAGL